MCILGYIREEVNMKRTNLVQVRLNDEELHKLDAIAAQLSLTGIGVNRTDVIRFLITTHQASQPTN
jgi:hypothetical protein